MRFNKKTIAMIVFLSLYALIYTGWAIFGIIKWGWAAVQIVVVLSLFISGMFYIILDMKE